MKTALKPRFEEWQTLKVYYLSNMASRNELESLDFSLNKTGSILLGESDQIKAFDFLKKLQILISTFSVTSNGPAARSRSAHRDS